MIFLLWMTWSAGPVGQPIAPAPLGAALFLAFFALLVGVLGLWSRLMARRVMGDNLHRSLHRFNRVMTVARILIPAWFAFGLFGLGWGYLTMSILGPAARWPADRPMELPSILLGTLPPFLAWMGLWWSQYPADRALREQSLMIQLDESLPVHAAPGFWRYFVANLRLQVLFNLVPVLLILLVRDVAILLLGPRDAHYRDLIELTVSLGAAGFILMLAPEVLRRVLETQSLPASPLRRRLESLCRRHGLRYRDILLWRTQNNMGNAAVMGILPRVRYFLLSDLLLETMTDEQVEAVFAHELGHLVHRHMIWLVLSIAVFMLAVIGPGTWIEHQVNFIHAPSWLPMGLVMLLVGVGLFVVVFGYLSRRFERQADVFAARTMQSERDVAAVQRSLGEGQAMAVGTPSLIQANPNSAVGAQGAALFASSLHRVAVINNIPVSGREWLHGSIAHRMRYVHHLSDDPARTAQFDRLMRRLYAVLVLALLVFGGWAAVVLWHESQSGPSAADDTALVRR